MEILTIANKKEEKILRRKTPDFDFSRHDRKEIAEMIKKMRFVIKREKGIGLSANQLGFDWRLFIAEIPGDKGKPKFYAIFNPGVIKASKEKTPLEEGCLSVPGIWGTVERANQIVLAGTDKNNRKLKIKAWGLPAQVFQHETDHLNGILFIDRALRLYKGEIEETETKSKL